MFLNYIFNIDKNIFFKIIAIIYCKFIVISKANIWLMSRHYIIFKYLLFHYLDNYITINQYKIYALFELVIIL